MASNYKIQVVYARSGAVVEWAPGQQVEKDLGTELIARVKVKKVGLMKTEAHVLEAVQQALHELLYELKDSVTPG